MRNFINVSVIMSGAVLLVDGLAVKMGFQIDRDLNAARNIANRLSSALKREASNPQGR